MGKAGRVAAVGVRVVAVKVPATARRVAKEGKGVDRVVRVIAKAVPGAVRRVAKAGAARRVVPSARPVPAMTRGRTSTE